MDDQYFNTFHPGCKVINILPNTTFNTFLCQMSSCINSEIADKASKL